MLLIWKDIKTKERSFDRFKDLAFPFETRKEGGGGEIRGLSAPHPSSWLYVFQVDAMYMNTIHAPLVIPLGVPFVFGFLSPPSAPSSS